MNLQGINGKLVAIQEAGTDNAKNVFARTPLDAAAGWENIQEEPQGDGTVALRCEGLYASAQVDGSLEWNRPWIRGWEKFTKVQQGNFVGYRSYHNKYMCTDLTKPFTTPHWTGHRVVCDRPNFGPWEAFTIIGVGGRQLVGPLRIIHDSYARTHSYMDDSGRRRILFCSWFCALRDFKDNRPAADVALDKIAAAGYQGIRIFRVLGFDWRQGGGLVDDGYFAGRGVSPDWSPDVLVSFADACRSRGLRLALSAGHKQMQYPRNDTLLFTQRWVNALHAAGLDSVISLVEGDNEFWQNAPYGTSAEQHAIYKDEFQIIRSTLNPAPFCAAGAPQDESPNNMFNAIQNSDILEIHGKRDQDVCIKRTHGRWYWEGNPGYFPTPMWEGEPAPAPSPDAFMPIDSKGRLTGLYAMSQLTGAALTHFSGWDVRGRGSDLDKVWSFNEMPKLLSHLPEDIASWGHEPGGQIWWWRGPGNMTATVVDEQWGKVYNPPRPLAWYKIIGPNGGVTEGAGALNLPAGFGGALIVGEFL